MPDAEKLLKVESFSCRYPDSRNWVLRDLSFSVRSGETLLILGPSGCGKSTLALCMKGLIPHAIDAEVRGRILLRGRDIVSEPSGDVTTAEEGIVFQDPETQLVMPRVSEEVAFGLENLRIPSERMEKRIISALSEVGLRQESRRWVETLSGGQKQRLALGSVLAMDPSLIILDEPTANLDPRGSSGLFNTLAGLKRARRLTILLIEHHLDDALPLVDRVLVLGRSGRIIAAGTPRNVFGKDYVRLEKEGIWLPTAVRLAAALRRRSPPAGAPPEQPPLTMEESVRFFAPFSEAGRVPERPLTASSIETGKTEPVLELEGISYTYPRGIQALRDITLSVEAGTFLALVGANGSGKSTLARLLCGLLRPQSGSCFLMGRSLRKIKTSELVRTIGYVFQNPEHQFVTEKVEEELVYSLKRHVPEEEVGRRVERLLRAFSLAGHREANPFALSQGQKRRLSVATMLALDQPVLILDEPTFGQDQASSRSLMRLLADLHGRGTTIIIITHDMHIVLEYAQTAAVMSEGRIIFRGTPGQLFQNQEVLDGSSLASPFHVRLGRRLGNPLVFAGEDWLPRA